MGFPAPGILGNSIESGWGSCRSLAPLSVLTPSAEVSSRPWSGKTVLLVRGLAVHTGPDVDIGVGVSGELCRGEHLTGRRHWPLARTHVSHGKVCARFWKRTIRVERRMGCVVHHCRQTVRTARMSRIQIARRSAGLCQRHGNGPQFAEHNHARRRRVQSSVQHAGWRARHNVTNLRTFKGDLSARAGWGEHRGLPEVL